MNFLKVVSKDQDLNRVQDNVDKAFQDLDKRTAMKSNVIEDVAVSVNDTIINHGLGRQCKYYVIIQSNADVSVYTSPTVNLNPKNQIILRANASGNVTLWVF